VLKREEERCAQERRGKVCSREKRKGVLEVGEQYRLWLMRDEEKCTKATSVSSKWVINGTSGSSLQVKSSSDGRWAHSDSDTCAGEEREAHSPGKVPS
jgi:hypothetical protein